MKQGGRSLKDYYSCVKFKWEELTLYQSYPKQTWKRQQEQLKVVSFLSGLDDSYVSTKNQLLSGTDLPSLNVSFSRLSWIPTASQDFSVDTDNTALTTNMRQAASRGRGWGHMGARNRCDGRTTSCRDDKYCIFCNRPGHVEESCWQKNGKPEWAKQSGSDDSNAHSVVPPLPLLLHPPQAIQLPYLMSILHTYWSLLMVSPLILQLPLPTPKQVLLELHPLPLGSLIQEHLAIWRVALIFFVILCCFLPQGELSWLTVVALQL